MIEIENAILKILLTDITKKDIIFDNCEELFFEDLLNRNIFKTAKLLNDEGIDIDNVTIVQYLKASKLNERLTEILIDTEAYSFRVKTYCKLLFDNYLKKLIISAKNKKDLENIENLKEKYAFNDSVIKHISEGAENFEKEYENKRNSLIITGWDLFDKYVGSFCGGDYIALGGGTGTGKTALALNIAKNLCILDKKVLYCSLEMTQEQLRNRFNCMIMDLNAGKYRSSEGFTKAEFEKYKEGLKTLNQWNLHILADYELTADKLKFYIQEQKKINGVDFIIIDYLGLLGGYNNKSEYEKATANSRKIKLIATELNVPILVLVQLNRDNKERKDDNKKPVLSDIRGSGAIEQDADFVIFAYSEYKYNPLANPEDLELIISKNRHGIDSRTIKMVYDRKTQNIRERIFQ